MPYTHTLTSDFINSILKQLDDVNAVTWTRPEVLLAIREGLDIINVLTFFQRDYDFFQLPTNTNFVDLRSVAALSDKIGFVKTIADLKMELDFHLNENALASSTIELQVYDTSQYDNLIKRKLQEFLARTKLLVTESVTNINDVPVYRLQMPLDVIDFGWLSFATTTESVNTEHTLSEESEQNLALAPSDMLNGRVEFFSRTVTNKNEIKFVPPISQKGRIRRLSVDNPVYTLILPIPSNLSWIIKYGILSEYYADNGKGYDERRAEYCKQRWEQGLQIAENIPLVLAGSILSRGIQFTNLADFGVNPNWMNESTASAIYIHTIAKHGWNMLVLQKKLDNGVIVNLELELLSNTILPSLESDYLQIPQDKLLTLKAYVLHYLSLKFGDDAFYAGMTKLKKLLDAATQEGELLSRIGNEFSLIPYREEVNAVDEVVSV